MTTVSLPPLPSTWSGNNFKATGKLTELESRSIEPLGPQFLAHARRILRDRTWSEDEALEAKRRAAEATEETDGDADLGDESETAEMLQHDPKDWKSLDQYAVLGLSHLRYKATEDQIRRAHRRKVLKHHPDKKAASGATVDEDKFFKCIQKAFETLITPNKRRQWDSVDKKATVSPPKKDDKRDFFEKWTPVFATEARFSMKPNVPLLGNAETEKAELDKFYNFWYNFDSWRSFEWLDEDVPDDSSNRDHKRYVEKKNKAARTKHKKEDNARLQNLVDQAMSEDPRIKAFKEAEKKAKAQRKWEREAGSREAAEKAQKEKEEAEKKAAEEAAAAKNNKEAAKKAKEAAKSAKKKNKRAIRASVKPLEDAADAADQVKLISDVDALIDALDDVTLGEVASKLGASPSEAVVKEVFTNGLQEKSITAKYFV